MCMCHDLPVMRNYYVYRQCFNYTCEDIPGKPSKLDILMGDNHAPCKIPFALISRIVSASLCAPTSLYIYTRVQLLTNLFLKRTFNSKICSKKKIYEIICLKKRGRSVNLAHLHLALIDLFTVLSVFFSSVRSQT